LNLFDFSLSLRKWPVNLNSAVRKAKLALASQSTVNELGAILLTSFWFPPKRFSAGPPRYLFWWFFTIFFQFFSCFIVCSGNLCLFFHAMQFAFWLCGRGQSPLLCWIFCVFLLYAFTMMDLTNNSFLW